MTFFAVIFCFLVAWPTTYVEFRGPPLVLFGLLAVVRCWRSMILIFGEPVFWIWCAWWAWGAVCLIWSPDRGLGWGELGWGRWWAGAPFLFTVFHRMPLLVGAVLAGFLCANLAQVSHAIGTAWDIPALRWNRMPDRNSGWWQPVVGGSMLTGALGMHLGLAFFGAGRWRIIGAAGALASFAGVIATGSRGAWIASALLVVIVALVALARGGWRRTQVLAAGGIVLVIAGAAWASWGSIGPRITRRVDLAVAEVRGALDRRDYSTDTGARVGMFLWASEAVKEQPLHGVGPGGYKSWVIEHLKKEGIDPATVSVHDHAHNAVMHAAATTGAPGGMLCVAAVASAFGAGVRRASRTRGGGIGMAAPCGLLGIALVSAFDVVQLNAQTSALLILLATLSLWRGERSGAETSVRLP